ncbi:MAG: sulfatase-like hydrolase/transferase [Candidatus Hydrogenedens sp.]|nr:sulfatase-like hydrolase/transferase [Candidatus Hydrogenedens sp.]
MKHLLLTLALLLSCAAHAAETPPNIVVILADDLGYGDVSCYGAEAVETPNIDRLAREGRRFTSGYCSASTCTPTRFSLLTGTFAFRQAGTGVAPPNAAAIIKPGTETLPAILKRAGYATAVVGKWHLGLGDPEPDWNGDLKPGPLELGFDHCLLLPTTNDRVPQVYVDDHRVRNLDLADPLWVGDKPPAPDFPTGVTLRDTLRMDWSHGHNESVHNGIGRIGFYTGGQDARFRDEDLADAWVKESVDWIEEHQNAPFFLYFASHDIHVPRMPHERFQGKTSLGYRGDAIVELDWCVGEITKALERLGIADNTLVVFCSDNGPVLDDGYKDGAVEKLGDHKPAGPFSGGKYTVLEGGTRTPFITWWPGRIAPSVSEDIVCTIDLAASLAALTGQSLSDSACLDSMNVLGALLGDANAQGRTELLQQDNSGNKFGLRVGDWKLVRQKAGKRGLVDSIYYLPDDPAESHDLAKDKPEELARLTARLDAIIADGRTRPAAD